MRARKLLSIGLLLLGAVFTQAQEKIRILFLLDASLSMRNEWVGGSKWSIASTALGTIADSISQFPNVEMGMRVFGHMYPEPDKNCRDSRLEVAIDSNNVARIHKKLNEIRPKGITPLVYSIEKCGMDFGNKPGRNILVVITDGEDACEGDPCGVSLMLQKHNIVLQPFIIGMALQPKSYNSMECMGKLFNTNTAQEFTTILNKVVVESISKTTLQVNLNDKYGNPTESDVNMTLYDEETGLVKYNFFHSMNARGLPDTLTVSPMFVYKLQVHTIPPQTIEHIALQKNRHNVVNLSVPQGYLNFSLQGTASKSAGIEKIKCLLHQPGETTTVHVQNVNSTEKYITGTYDLEVTTLPRTIVKDVKVEQSKTTDVLIPAPGIVTLNKSFEAYGGLFIVENGKMKKIYDLQLQDKQETLALQPGKYHLVYRSKYARTIHTTVDKEFEITTGGSLSLKL